MYEALFQPLPCLVLLGVAGVGLFTLVVLIQHYSRVPKLHRRVEELAAEIRTLRADLDSRVPPPADGSPSGPSPDREVRPPGA